MFTPEEEKNFFDNLNDSVQKLVKQQEIEYNKNLEWQKTDRYNEVKNFLKGREICTDGGYWAFDEISFDEFMEFCYAIKNNNDTLTDVDEYCEFENVIFIGNEFTLKEIYGQGVIYKLSGTEDNEDE